MKKLNKFIMCNILGLSVILGVPSSLYAQDSSAVQIKENIEIKSTLQTLLAEIEEVDRQKNECEINIKRDLEIQLSDVSLVKKSLTESLEQASWYKKIGIRKQLQKTIELEAAIQSSIEANNAMIENLKNRERYLQLKLENVVINKC